MKKSWQEWKPSDGDYVGEYKEPSKRDSVVNSKENTIVKILFVISGLAIFTIALSFFVEII